ncbi:MAG: 2-polyprenylphenol 6-hydroxylase [Rhodospirillaceae bacterium]|nr:2-polyprenylphenol 6-hydroxylase [Rhodospirillaceae bacterium]
MFRSLRQLLRLAAIARTLARHDALGPLVELMRGPGSAPVLLRGARFFFGRRSEGQPDMRPGEKLAAALVELGPVFIKFGQMLSTRTDLLGDRIAADLAQLQDRLPPFPASEARTTIERELGAPIGRLFAEFDDNPVSAASIAQVHFALLPEGDPFPYREVAIKVLRPGIEAAFGRDIALMEWLAELCERTQPALRRYHPIAVVETFAIIVQQEMDLRIEAAGANELAGNFAGDDSYVVPAVDWQRTARRVLTLQRLAGIRMDDRDRLLAAGHDLHDILAKAAAIFFKQAFRDGYFHGDQHPGNMFVDASGRIGAVDFGIMGRLDRQTRYYLADMLLGLLNRDYQRLADIHFAAGYVPSSKSPEAFAQALRAIGEPIFGRPLADISFAGVLGQLFQIAQTFEMEVQPQLLLLQKNMLMAEGVSRQLDSDLNIWTLAEPLIEDWMRENRGPEARVREALAETGRLVERLPRILRHLDTALTGFAEGGLRLHPETIRALGGGRRAGAPWWLVAILGIVLLLVLVH